MSNGLSIEYLGCCILRAYNKMFWYFDTYFVFFTTKLINLISLINSIELSITSITIFSRGEWVWVEIIVILVIDSSILFINEIRLINFVVKNTKYVSKYQNIFIMCVRPRNSSLQMCAGEECSSSQLYAGEECLWAIENLLDCNITYVLVMGYIKNPLCRVPSEKPRNVTIEHKMSTKSTVRSYRLYQVRTVL